MALTVYETFARVENDETELLVRVKLLAKQSTFANQCAKSVEKAVTYQPRSKTCLRYLELLALCSRVPVGMKFELDV